MADIPGTEQLPGPTPEDNPTSPHLYGLKPGVVLADAMAAAPGANLPTKVDHALRHG
jgi:hypothetical protein